jgi:replication factor C subunit 1
LNEFIHFSLLGQMSKANKGWRLLRELHMHMSLHISGDKNEIRQNYMPALIPRLTKPLVERGAVRY